VPPSSAVLPSPSSCAALPIADGQPPNDFAAAVNQVTAKAQLLVREEIELAKVEVTEKVTSLTKGAIVAIVAGSFVVAGLVFLGHAVAWGLYALFFNDVAWGYLIVAGSLFIFGGLAGFLASRAFKAGAPPTPDLAIDEAQKIRDLVDAARTTPLTQPLVVAPVAAATTPAAPSTPAQTTAPAAATQATPGTSTDGESHT